MARFSDDCSVKVAMKATSRGQLSGEPQLDKAVQQWLDWDKVRLPLTRTLALLSLKTQMKCLGTPSHYFIYRTKLRHHGEGAIFQVTQKEW